MPKVEFAGQSTQDSDNRAGTGSRLINVYREPVMSGGRTRHVLKTVLGTTSFARLSGVFIRAMATVDSNLFAVCGSRLWGISSFGGRTDHGEIGYSVDASLAGNNGDVTVCSDGRYFVLRDGVLSEPATGAFDTFGGLAYIGNYTVLTEKNGRKFQWSGLADAPDLPGLNFSTADGKDDDCIRPFEINGQLYILKQESYEIWYLTGGAGADAFTRAVGGVKSVGLKSYNLICALPDAAFMVGSDGKAHILAGGLKPVSTPAVETAIKDLGPLYCHTYEDEGHIFCSITFKYGPAWSYDLSTGEWHERAEGVGLLPWSVSVTTKYNGIWLAGRDDGRVLQMGKYAIDIAAEGGPQPLVREVTSKTLDFDGDRRTINEFEIFTRQGFTGGAVSLSLSRDNGITWGGEITKDLGPAGEYGKRLVWRRLGQARQITAKLRWSHGDNIPIDAEARVKL